MGHPAILVTFIKLPFVIKIFVLSFFEWPLKTGFTVFHYLTYKTNSEQPLDWLVRNSPEKIWVVSGMPVDQPWSRTFYVVYGI